MAKLKIVIVDDDATVAAVYLVTSGEVWRVWDSVGEPSRRTASPPADAFATHRLFLSRDGARRVYTFVGKDTHALVPRELMRQLTAGKPTPKARR